MTNKINITFLSSINNTTLIRHNEIFVENNRNNLKRFDQRELIGVNGTYSQRIHMSLNGFDDLPIFNLLDVRYLDMSKNFIRRLDHSGYLPLQIEVFFCCHCC